MPLLQALKERMTTRTFRGEELSPALMSDLLWAAFGVNRPDSGKRTAPSARNYQEIDIYVITAGGAYRYDAKGNALAPVSEKDLRSLAGTQEYVKEAPVNLIYVADYSKMGNIGDEEKLFLSAADTGLIGQNVYLFCASEGLGAVIRAAIDKPALSTALGLRADQKIVLGQSVGFPKN